MTEPTLLDAWRNWTPRSGWQCYPDDEARLKRLAATKVAPVNLDWDGLVGEPAFGSKDSRLHLTLVPIPFLGNLETAKVVVLLQNPGFAPTDYYGEFKVPGFRDLLLKNLRGDLKNDDYPFFFLDPTLAWHGGFTWWQEQLGSVIDVMTDASTSHLKARRNLAKGLACIELMPYHSESGVVSKAFLDKLPSAKLARNYLWGPLVARAKKADVTIVAARHVDPWGFERSAEPGKFNIPLGLNSDSCVIYRTKQARRASLSATSRGGRAILLAMGVPLDRIPKSKNQPR